MTPELPVSSSDRDDSDDPLVVDVWSIVMLILHGEGSEKEIQQRGRGEEGKGSLSHSMAIHCAQRDCTYGMVMVVIDNHSLAGFLKINNSINNCKHLQAYSNIDSRGQSCPKVPKGRPPHRRGAGLREKISRRHTTEQHTGTAVEDGRTEGR